MMFVVQIAIGTWLGILLTIGSIFLGTAAMTYRDKQRRMFGRHWWGRI